MITTIDINGLTLTTFGDITISPPVQGVSLPEIRTSGNNYSGRDGGYVSTQFYGRREIVINGSINAYCDNVYEIKCEIQKSLPIRTLLPITITVGETNYYTEAYVIDLDMPMTDPTGNIFTITLLAPDPYFYGGNSGSIDPEGWIEQPIYKVFGGGYKTPYVLPVAWEPGNTPATVNNPGDIWIYPQIVLEDKWTNPRVTNVTTGQYIELGVSTTTGDIIVIDMRERTVTLNGGSILPFRELGSSWWALIPGNNVISIESDSSEDSSEGTIRYRVAYTGVFEGLC